MSCPGCFLNIKTVQFVLFQGNLSQIASCGREDYFGSFACTYNVRMCAPCKNNPESQSRGGRVASLLPRVSESIPHAPGSNHC